MNFPNLLTPGPVPMPPEVYRALGEPMTHHRTPEFNRQLRSCLSSLKGVFQTDDPVLIQTSTGSGSMESAVVNTLSQGDEVLVIVAGKFGQRWRDICQAYGLKVHTLDVEWGQPLHLDNLKKCLDLQPQLKAVLSQYCETSTGALLPIKEIATLLKNYPSILFMVDAITAIGAVELKTKKWGLDVVCAGSQKAFMMPTGLSFISLSEKAWLANQKSNLPKYYFDLNRERQAQLSGQTYFSSAVSHIKALSAYFEYFNSKGGLEFSIQRCAELSLATREAMEHFNLDVFPKPPSPSLSTFLLPERVSAKKFRQHLEDKYQTIIMNGQDHLVDKIIRIGHLGYIKNQNLIDAIVSIGMALKDMGLPIRENQLKLAKLACQNTLKGEA